MVILFQQTLFLQIKTKVSRFVFKQPNINNLIRIFAKILFLDPIDRPFDGSLSPFSNLCWLVVTDNNKRLLDDNMKIAVR